MSKKKLVSCGCGCGKMVNPRQAWKGVVIYDHKDEYIRKIMQGEVEPPLRITCEFKLCRAENVPAVWSRQKYCDPDLTGRDCRLESKRAKIRENSDAARRMLREHNYHAERGRWRNPRFNTHAVCMTPSPCLYYSEGYGCPARITPCSDRSELGELWEYERNGRSPCWTKGKERHYNNRPSLSGGCMKINYSRVKGGAE